MKNKYSRKDRITEKYNFREKYINIIQNISMGTGYIYSLCNMVPSFVKDHHISDNEAIKVMSGFLAGTLSYFLGNYLQKVNENNKNKALKNLEERTEVKD
jgi:hypothetical protein